MLTNIRGSLLITLLAAGATSLTVLGLSPSDGAIQRSFAQAFHGVDTGSASRSATTGFDPAHLHLSRAAMDGSVGPHLVVGDRITLSQQSGGSLSYEVVDVRPLVGATGTEAAAGQPRLSMVTAIAKSEMPVRTVRFLIEAGPQVGGQPAPKPHAL